jgi:hypothetical protein
MKVFELLEYDTKIDLTPRQVQRSIDVTKGGELGSGFQAWVGKTKSNTAIKKAKIPSRNPENSAYVQFVKLVSEHQDNPFFPRIYSAKLLQEPLGDQFLIVHMEKLYPIEHPKIRFNVKEMSKLLKLPNIFTDFSVDRPEIRKEIAEKTKNPKLKEALELLEPMFVKYGSDMHRENWMVRLTSIGPQIVIADPFYSEN